MNDNSNSYYMTDANNNYSQYSTYENENHYKSIGYDEREKR